MGEMSMLIDLTGKTFGRLTVLRRDNSRKGAVYWWCECSCENKTIKSINGHSLKRGYTNSCGCLRQENSAFVSREYKKRYNTYDLSGEYGIGYTAKDEEFYFDLEDYDKIKNYSWSLSAGYVCTTESIKMHRVVMNAKDEEMVDHISHNVNDNRKINLRLVNNSKNQMNKVMQKNNTSGVVGVSWSNRDNHWVARISINSKCIHLGVFKDFQEAAKIRKEAEEKYFGKFSYSNSLQSNIND